MNAGSTVDGRATQAFWGARLMYEGYSRRRLEVEEWVTSAAGPSRLPVRRLGDGSSLLCMQLDASMPLRHAV